MSAQRLPYNPALDGLRALAVSAVLLFHGLPESFPGGFLGVSTFFTLSGYLMGSLLLLEHERTGRIDLAAFWVRRVRRLMPAALLTLVAIGIGGSLLASGRSLTEVRDDALAALLYVANWHFIRSGQSYVDLFLQPSPVQHFWSLAIEEQFYFAFPLLTVVVLVRGRASRRSLGGVYAALAVASVLWCAHLGASSGDPSRVYYGTDTRAFELLLGALLAVASAGRMPRGRGTDVLGVVALVAAAIAWRVADDRAGWLYPWGLLAYAAGTVVILAACARDGVVRRLLSLPPLPAVGRISYGLYLFHWPVDLWLSEQRTGLASWSLFGVRTALTLVLAVASYALLERPVRLGTWPAPGRPARRAALGAVAITLVALMLLPVRGAGDSIVLDQGVDAARAPAPAAEDGRARILLVGDSVAASLAGGFRRWAEQRPDVRFESVARANCGLLHTHLPVCADLRDSWADALRGFDPDLILALPSYWDVAERPKRRPRREAEWSQALGAGLLEVAGLLGRRDAGIAWLTLPCVRANVEETVMPLLGRIDGVRVVALNGHTLPELIAVQRRSAPREPWHLVDLAGLVCPEGAFRSALGPAPDGRPDGVHFTEAAASWVASELGDDIAARAREAHERRAKRARRASPDP